MREKKFRGREDAGHILAALPRLAPLEKVHPRIVAALDEWEPGRGNLVISGPTNAGKTSGVALRCRALLDEVLEATSMVFAEAQELVESAALRERAMCVRFLVVDDLGQEHDPKNHLFRVYNARYRSGLETLTTTGWRLADIERRLGSHMIKRLMNFSRRGKLVSGSIVEVFAPKVRPTPSRAVGTPENPASFHDPTGAH